MESSAIMGEADENICKEKANAGDDVCVNGNISCDDDDIMEVDSDISKAPAKNVESVENHKVPEKEVPTEQTENGADSMDVDQEEQDDDKSIDEQHENDKNSKSLTNGTDNSVNDSDVNMEASNLDSSVELVENKENNKSVDLNDLSDVVVIEADSERKENGDRCNSPDVEEVINISDKDADVSSTVTPQKKKARKSSELSGPIRRSSRNLHKQKTYIEKEDDPDIEEITPEDPLADPLRDDKENNKKTKHSTQHSSSTIVVSDTKRLVEIAANSKASNSAGKKEPTLVIIDTNSILSGRGAVPVTQKPATITTSFSMMPVALPAQGVYPPNMRATITPIPMSQVKQHTQPIVPQAPPPTPILPTLTDDMFVVEAPSFIVPYVYEKPPIKPFKDFVAEIAKEIEENKKIEEEYRKKKEENRKKEEELRKADKEKIKQEAKEENKEDEDESDKESEEEKTEDDIKKTELDKVDKVKDEEESESEEDKDVKKEIKDEKTNDKVKEEDVDGESKKTNDVKIVDKPKPEPAADGAKTIDLDEIPDDATKPKSNSYFDGALGNFFINIGFGLVQEFVQTDLLKQQKRKNNREGNTSIDTKMAINSLIKNLEYSKENNEPFRLPQRKCEYCSFKTESNLVLSHHLETPHMRNYVYKCNFCPLEVRSPHDILFHMEAEHNIRGRLERAPAFHQCPNCPFEDNQKGKLSRHLINCLKKFKPEKNLDPPQDWEPPAKIPRVPKVKQTGIAATAATYQALAQQQKNNSYQLYKKLQGQASPQVFPRGRGRPSLMGSVNPIRPQPPIIRTNMMYRPGTSGSILVPTSYQFAGNQVFQVVGGQGDVTTRLTGSTPVALVSNVASATNTTLTVQNSSNNKSNSSKVVQQPSISITPLPRQPSGTTITKTSAPASTQNADSSSKATFVICEICDGYIKDLEQLRNHMQWIHKVKIHPKMIYNRPPLNCQKCQFRFFTDQGLERHLLGSHGLVTSSMQEAANKSKDAGRCPVCGRVYQWKLLNHVARDHNMTLKPAHLSYKCTVCTATFGMYKQFENHVYSAHSVVAKRVMEKKASSPSSRATNDSLLKPLKINDEITIIPQPAKAKNNSATASKNATSSSNDRGK